MNDYIREIFEQACIYAEMPGRSCDVTCYYTSPPEPGEVTTTSPSAERRDRPGVPLVDIVL